MMRDCDLLTIMGIDVSLILEFGCQTGGKTIDYFYVYNT